MMLQDQQGIVIKESITLRAQLVDLVQLLDSSEINAIAYGLPDVPLSQQSVHQLIRFTRSGFTPHYAVRIMGNGQSVRNEAKFALDMVGRQDAIDEFVERCASQKARASRLTSSQAARQVNTLGLFIQRTLLFKPLFTWAT
jgi:hypothetical protein